ncbi:MAG: hypothetical protein HY291_02160 [Planctomycetes bacterium]|nr:hypothetical protein [Planctomycetota bacterium]
MEQQQIDPQVYVRRLHRMLFFLNQHPDLERQHPDARPAIEAKLGRMQAFARAHRAHPEAVPLQLCPCAGLEAPVQDLQGWKTSDHARLRLGLPTRNTAYIQEVEAFLPIARLMPQEFPLLVRKARRQKGEPRYDVSRYNAKRVELEAGLAHLERKPESWRTGKTGRAAIECQKLRLDILRAAKAIADGEFWAPSHTYTFLDLAVLCDWKFRRQVIRSLSLRVMGFYGNEEALQECFERIADQWMPEADDDHQDRREAA